MTQYVRLPDGSRFPLNEGETEAQALAAAYAKYPEAWGAAPGSGPKSGFAPALKAGFENLKGDVAALAGRSGIMDLKAAEDYRTRKEAEAARIFKPTEDNWIESPLTKLGELAGGSLPYMVAPAAAAASALLLPEAVAAAPILGGLTSAGTALGAGAAGLTSAAQFTGSNLGRQVGTGKSLGETDLGAAALASVPQAALDMVGFKMVPGLRNLIFKTTGKQLAEKEVAEIAKQGLKATAKDYAVATGKTMGAEGLTEAAQQVFERMQAGLSLTDPEAQKEYFDNFLGGAVLGGALAPAGRFVERGQIKGEQAAKARVEEQAQREAAIKAQEDADAARKAAPEYIPGLLSQSDKFAQQIKALDTAAKAGDEADPVSMAAAQQAKADLRALKTSDAYKAHLEELQAAAPQIQTMRAQQAQAAADKAKAEQAAQEAKLNDPALQSQLHGQFDALSGQLADLRNKIDASVRAGDTGQASALTKQFQEIDAQRKALQPQLGARPTPPAVQSVEDMQAELQRLVGTTTKNGFPKAGEIMKAFDAGDTSAYEALLKRAEDLRQKIAEPTRARDAVQRQIEDFKARNAPAPEATPAPVTPEGKPALPENLSPEAGAAWLRDRYEALKDSQRTPLNPSFTEQRELPLTANPVQQTSGATVVRREKTLEDLKNEFGALVRSARVQRVQGRVPDALKEQIAAKADEIRDFQNAVARQGVPRGQETADVAEALAGTRAPEGLPPRQNVENVPRTYTPAEASAAAVQEELGRLPDNLAPEDDALVAQITRSMPSLKTAGMPSETVAAPSIEGVPYDKVTAELAPTRALDDVAAYLHKLRTGNDASVEAAQVREHLDRIEKAKRSETQTPTRETAWGTATKPTETAVQEDMFQDTELHGTLFNTYAEFENYLAGDAVQEARKAVGQTLPTVARLRRMVAPMEAEAARLRNRLEGLQAYFAGMTAANDTAIANAEAKLKEARDALDAQLHPLQAQLIEAQLALSKALDAQAKIADTIAKNTAKFNRDPGIQEAAAKVATVQQAHAALLKQAANGSKVDYTQANKLYQAVVAAINEHRTLLEQYAKDSRKLQERSILAFLNRDMELMLRLRDADQTVEQARASVEAAQQALNEAAAAQNRRPVSTAQGVLTRTRNRAMEMRNANVEAMKETSDAARAAQAEVTAAEKPVQEARDRRVAPPLEETKTQREDRDNEIRRQAQEQAERLAAIPGVQVTHENVAKTMAEAEKLPERIRALDAVAKDDTKPKTTRDKAKHDAKVLREHGQMLRMLMDNDPKYAQAAKDELDRRIGDVNEKINAKRVAVNEEGIKPSTLRSRRKQLSDLLGDLRELKRLRKMADQRATFAPVGTNKTSTRALADTLEAVQDKLRATEDPKVKEALQKQADTIQAELDRRDEAEQRLTLERGINLETEGTTGKLPARIIGPVVKKAVQAGNIRTGDTSTTGERMAGSRNKATQGGKKKGITGAQAVAQAQQDVAHEQALLKLSNLEDLQERNDAALAKAREDKDAAKIAKYEGFAARLQEGIAAAQKQVDKTARVAPETSMLDADEVASQFRSDRETTEVDDDVVQAVLDGRILDVAKLLAARGSTPEVRARAAKLQPLLMRTKLKAAPTVLVNGESVAGKFDPATNTITMAHGGINEEDLLHEMTHAATDNQLTADESTLTPDQLDAKQSLERLRAAIAGTDRFKDEQIPNVREFAAEVYSNQSLRDKLDKVGGVRTLLNRVLNFFKRLLGWGTPTDPLSKKTEALVERLMMPSRAVPKSTAGAVPSLLRKPEYDTASAVGKLAAEITAAPVSPRERFTKNTALSLEMWGVDMRAPLMKALSVAGDKALTQASYYVRKADALMNHVYAALGAGPLQLKKDAKGFFAIEGGNGPNMQAILEAVGNVKGVSIEDKMAKAQAYLVSQRAARVGWDALNFNPAIAGKMQQLAAAMDKELAVDPEQKKALEGVRRVYNEYNKGMVNFLAESGYLSKDKAADLLRHGDYVPFYRVKPNGVAEFVMGEGAIIHVGDLRNNKFLAPLVGDDQKLLPLNEAMIRNTMLLTDLATKNLASKDVAYALQKIGVGKIRKGEGPRGEHDIIRFRQEPDPMDDTDDGERYIRVNTSGTAVEHIPNEMLVQSLEGSFSTLPAGLKALSWFGDVLRSGVTRNPMYIARQLIRDPMAATFTGGLESGVVKGVFKSLGNFTDQMAGRSQEGVDLLRKGLIHSGIFTGDVDDINKIALQLANGDQGAFKKTLAWWDKAAMNADAATRIQLYKDALGKGMSEVEAEFAAMEMMNFNKRGLSPTVQYASRLIPFLNAQIQGLNVLVKAMTGNMPQNEKLQIKEKFYRRAMTMALFTVAYAMAMDDDDTYKNARARDRYSNWFLPNPLGGEHIKIPIPFEVGVLFKALPEAMVDVMKGEFGEQEWKAVKGAFTQQIPGASSYGLPQAVKPMIEVVTNHNFFTDREIESKADLGKVSQERFGPGTTEIAKEMSKVFNAMGMELSPKQIDHLVSGYLGSLPTMVARLTNNVFSSAEGPVRPTERTSDSPIYGSLFQREIGGGAVDAAYAQQDALEKAKKSYDDMIAQGRKVDAEAFKENVLNALGSPELMARWKTRATALAKEEKEVRLRIKDPDALRARLDEIERKRNEAAKLYVSAVQQIAH